MILDVRLPDGTGIEVCRDLRSLLPDLKCLMLTSFNDDEALFDSIMAGAAGQSLLDPVATARVLERLRNPPRDQAAVYAARLAERRAHPAGS